MVLRSYETGQDNNINEKLGGQRNSGGNRKESPGNEVDVVLACD